MSATTSVKTPDQVHNQFAANVESGAAWITTNVLGIFARTGKRAVLNAVGESDAALELAATRLNEAGWAVEYGPRCDSSFFAVPTIALTGRDDFIERSEKDFKDSCLNYVWVNFLAFCLGGFAASMVSNSCLWFTLFMVLGGLVSLGAWFYLMSDSKVRSRRAKLLERDWRALRVKIVKTK